MPLKLGRANISFTVYFGLVSLRKSNVSAVLQKSNPGEENGTSTIDLLLKNNSKTVAFANRLRLVNRVTKRRILPIIMNDNSVTLM
ncbi:hypothetical protein ACVWYG_001953 [Pedobacter sp. UYEF25]